MKKALDYVSDYQLKSASSQFSVEMCAASKNCKKFTKKPFEREGGIQGH